MSILDLFLKKKGVKSPNELDNTPNSDGSPTEKQVFEKWRDVLSKSDTLTTDEVKLFCQGQIDLIEKKWADLNLSQAQKAELIPYHTVYKTLEQVVDTPKAEREQLEKQLRELLK